MTMLARFSLLLATSTFLVSPVTPVSAQSRAPKASPTQPVSAATPKSTAYSWTGFYLGLSAGLNGGNYQYRPIEIEALNQGEPEEQVWNRVRNTASGGMIGIQGGYLYQFPSNIVLGVEADYNWTDYRSSMAINEISSAGEAETELAKLRVGGLGSLRARLGYAFGPILPYVTGGVAVGRTSDLFAEGAEEPGQPMIARQGRNTWGFALGAGVEYAITPALRVKTEYVYTSLSSFQAVALENVGFKLGSRFSTLRVGLNYAFGQDGASFQPLAPREGFAPRFDGFSIGLTAGLAGGSSSASLATVEETETTTANDTSQLFGGLIGAEIGYHYRFTNNVVIGAVADYQFTNYQKEAFEVEQAPEESAKEKARLSIPQFGTVRLRAGYAMGAFLPYVTAGFAYGKAEYRSAELPIEEGVVPGRLNGTKTGYTLGVGLEYAITSQLFFKTEYLYVNLGSLKGALNATESYSASLPINVGRIGLTYRF